MSIPSPVTKIGRQAFYNDTGITSLTIASTVTSIGAEAFLGTIKLSKINFNAKNCAVPEIWQYDNNKGVGVFSGAGSAAASLNVTFGSGVTKVPERLFNTDREHNYEYAYITSVSIPSSVKEIGSSKSAASAVKQIRYMKAPAISGLTNGSTGVTVKWGKVTGATQYQVYRSTNGGSYSKITTVTGNSYTDTGAKSNGVKYSYKVYAYDGSSRSAASAAKTIYYVSRPSVSGLTSSTAGKITVKWSRNTKASGYVIQYSTSSGFTASTTKTVTISGNSTVSKTFSGLSKGKKYYVRIRSFKTVSGTKYYSAWSSSKYVTTKK